MSCTQPNFIKARIEVPGEYAKHFKAGNLGLDDAYLGSINGIPH